MRGIIQLQYTIPTPIQTAAIPAGIDGKDIIAIAQTGSGKTVAFGIPMLQQLAKSKRGVGLVLVPTRELALQVEESLRLISRNVHLRSTVIIGGASMMLQRNALKKNPRIIIATPGRLMDHIDRRTVDLSNVEVFILDEADRMLDMGFVRDIRKIEKEIPEKRQTMLFSATMPKEIEAIAETLMTDPVHIEIDRSGATPTEVSHEMFLVKNQDKSRLLAVQLKKISGPVLVFTRTKRMAHRLTARVNEMGFAAAEIHANRSLVQRRHALDGFKRGTYQILVATDIAARGIDVTGIELVVNYDMPANSEDYVHRIGRTGRAGKTGHAVSYATIDQKSSIRSIERFMKTKLAISALPTLPSERHLLETTDQRNSHSELSRDGRPWRPADTNANDSRRPASRSRVSRTQKSKATDANRDDSSGEKHFWSRFKKSRTDKKKSVGQGTGRKRRPGRG